MNTKLKRLGTRSLVGLAVATGPTLAACSTGPSYEEWAETDGAAGRINLDAVQEAFKASKSATDFEKRVNEIYEGDGFILVRAQQVDGQLILEGWEDLDSNTLISEQADDQLFSITQHKDNNYETRGYHANSYYHSNFGAGNFLFTYMMISSLTPRGYFYSSPPGNYSVRAHRNRYRTSNQYRNQVNNNSSYFNRQKSFGGSRYSESGRKLSQSRQTYQSRSKSRGSFRTSSTGVRSSWGSSGRGSSFGRASSGGGFRGGGGGQMIVGSMRDKEL